MSPGFSAAVILALVRPAPVILAAAVAELDARAACRADGAAPRSQWSTRLERVAGYGLLDVSCRPSARCADSSRLTAGLRM
jgi:hypothetical protein